MQVRQEPPVQVRQESVQVRQEPVQVRQESPVQVRQEPVQVRQEPVQVAPLARVASLSSAAPRRSAGRPPGWLAGAAVWPWSAVARRPSGRQSQPARPVPPPGGREGGGARRRHAAWQSALPARLGSGASEHDSRPGVVLGGRRRGKYMQNIQQCGKGWIHPSGWRQLLYTSDTNM